MSNIIKSPYYPNTHSIDISVESPQTKGNDLPEYPTKSHSQQQKQKLVNVCVIVSITLSLVIVLTIITVGVLKFHNKI